MPLSPLSFTRLPLLSRKMFPLIDPLAPPDVVGGTPTLKVTTLFGFAVPPTRPRIVPVEPFLIVSRATVNVPDPLPLRSPHDTSVVVLLKISEPTCAVG